MFELVLTIYNLKMEQVDEYRQEYPAGICETVKDSIETAVVSSGLAIHNFMQRGQASSWRGLYGYHTLQCVESGAVTDDEG